MPNLEDGRLLSRVEPSCVLFFNCRLASRNDLISFSTTSLDSLINLSPFVLEFDGIA